MESAEPQTTGTPSGKPPMLTESPTPSSTAPLRAREMLAVVGLVVLTDMTVYRSHGYAGFAVLAATAPCLLWFGSRIRRVTTPIILTALLLAVLGLRLASCGGPLMVAAGIALLAAFAAANAGIVPYAFDTTAFAAQSVGAGLVAFASQVECCFRATNRHSTSNGSRFQWLSVVLPAIALMVFGMIFTLANPDLLSSMGERVQWVIQGFRDLFANLLPRPLQAIFWLAVGCTSLGALRPMVSIVRSEETLTPIQTNTSPLFTPFRNTLMAVIALFAVYLMFEFKTLWFRKFPAGFHYSGYAHEGAAWLTIALGLATAMLSAVFRGSILGDPRCRRLKTLSWIWCAENLLLAIAVFNRLNIYVGFNGMTTMRVIGYFGISAVVAGLLVVIGKIHLGKNFRWLIRRQTWVLAAAIYLYSIAPVDSWTTHYNVGRILEGDSAPSVQISVHPISDEGLLELPRLLSASDDKVREGVRSLLHERLLEIERQAPKNAKLGWTAVQWSRSRLLTKLRGLEKEFTQGKAQRDAARKVFDDYAYQWY